jgi:serine/threonine-protein kinase
MDDPAPQPTVRKGDPRGEINNTIELTTPPVSDSSGPQNRQVNLVTGSGPGLSGEVTSVLRNRLRMASILLACGQLAFLIWGTIEAEFLEKPEYTIVYVMHCVSTFSCFYAAYALCRKCEHSLAKLRAFEFFIFLVVAVFFSFVQYTAMVEMADKGFLPRNMGPWQTLIFTYALLIPNTWRRALPLLLVCAFAPEVIAGLVVATNAKALELLLHDPTIIVEYLLGSGITFGVAIVGIHSINQLRTEAFEAKQVGQYRLKRLLGSGGMGEVYLAEHRMMKRPCAIKIIRPDKAGDPLTLARFEREVRTIAKLSHWNNIDIYDYGRTQDGTFYYVMEFLPGLNLNELVKRYGPMAPERVVYLMRQACDALNEAHKLGLVHRDIKPANIFSAIRGGLYDVTKVLDFGLAKPIAASEGSGITQEGHITGSPLYMSPEQATGDTEPDARSDIYSLGAVMYYMLTGRPPFDYEKPLKVIIAHAHDTVPPLKNYRPGLPEDLVKIVMRSLEKNPDDRFQDAEHLMLALDSCSVARGWNRIKAAQWWDEACADGACHWEPASSTEADASLTIESATTKA